MIYVSKTAFYLLFLVLPSSFADDVHQNPPNAEAANSNRDPNVYRGSYQAGPAEYRQSYGRQPELYHRFPELKPGPERLAVSHQPETRSEPEYKPQEQPRGYVITSTHREGPRQNPFLHYAMHLPQSRPEMVPYHQPGGLASRLFSNPHRYDKIHHEPDKLYNPEEIYRSFPFYKYQPDFADYAPSAYTKSRRRNMLTTPRSHGRQTAPSSEERSILVTVAPSYEEAPQNVSHEVKISFAPQPPEPVKKHSHVHHTAPVYAIITDESTNNQKDMVPFPARKQTFGEDRPPQKSRVSQDRASHSSRHRIPVPFVKVIRFYPLSSKSSEENQEVRKAPEYYVPSRSNAGYTSEVKDIHDPETLSGMSGNKAKSAGTGYARFQPVYYGLPGFFPTPNKTGVRVTGI